MTQTKTQGKRNRPKAAAATGQTARFLVVGTAIAETILHQPGGGERRGLEGVAATIALAEAGNEVTLVTSIGQGPEGTRAKNLLTDTPLRTIIRDSAGAAGFATINTRQGEQQRANGRWPRATGLGRLAEREIHRHEVIIADTNMSPGDLLQMLDHPGKLTMVNGTTTLGAARIPTRWNNRLGMLTVNRAEARTLMQRLDCSGERADAPAQGWKHAVDQGPKRMEILRPERRHGGVSRRTGAGAHRLHRLRGLRRRRGSSRSGARARPGGHHQRVHPEEAGSQRGAPEEFGDRMYRLTKEKRPVLKENHPAQQADYDSDPSRQRGHDHAGRGHTESECR